MSIHGTRQYIGQGNFGDSLYTDICQQCGALIPEDPKLHTAWHDGERDLLASLKRYVGDVETRLRTLEAATNRRIDQLIGDDK